MARFLLTVWSFETHLNPNLALAGALAAAGHEVAFYTGPRGGRAARELGFRCFEFQELDEPYYDRVVDSILAERRKPRRLHQLWRDLFLESVPAQLRDLERVFREWPPDAIVCDMALWGPILILGEARRIPVAVLSHVGYCMLPGRDGPVPGISLPRPRGPLMRLAGRLVAAAVNLRTADVPRDAGRLRSRYGLPDTGMRMTRLYGEMPLYLIPSVPEFDYRRRDLPDSVRYIGACLWPSPPARDAGLPPRVVVFEGTLHAPEPLLLRAAVEGLADLPVEVIVVPGKARDLSQLRFAIPKNVRLVGWQPLPCVLRPADVLVTTGNTEDAVCAVSQGVPLVVAPSILDQSEMAWRVEESGAGIRLPEKRCTPAGLRAAVKRLLEEPGYRKNAVILARTFAGYSGPKLAVELLENVIGFRGK